jgi:hypothetical protein
LRCLFALYLLLSILCITTTVIAQSTDATVSGLVLDPSGRVIPNADIEILNESTGVLYSGKTNETGIYTVSILPPGQYRLQVSKIGFKSLIKPGIVLNVQSAVALNFTLPIGATSETVTVGAGASLINTTDASVSTVIDSKFVENIPLNGRSFQDLISLTPGVVTQSPQARSSVDASGDFSVNGQRTESNYYTVDGVSANANPGDGYNNSGGNGTLAASTALGTTQSLTSVDALQEFRVQGSTYSAEYGNSPGGQFSFVTRSGTNDLHGSASEYLRNNYFDANDWFDNDYGTPSQALRQNDFGGTLGGPIVLPDLYKGRSRSFFFVSYEGLRLTQPQAATVQYVPDTSARQNSAEALMPIILAYPLPTPGAQDYGFLAQFIAAYSLPSQLDSTSVRIDQVLNSRLSAFFRFSDTPSTVQTRLLSAVSATENNTKTLTFGLSDRASNAVTDEFRLGYTSGKSLVSGTLDNFGGAQPIDLAQAIGVGMYSSPTLIVLLDQVSEGIAELAVSNTESDIQQWNIVDTLSVSQGKHLMKFGGDYRRITVPARPYDPLIEALYQSPSSLLDNSSINFVGRYIGATPVFNDLGVFGQDQWKIVPRLTISAGFRWELAPPPTNSDGKDAYTVLGDIGNPASLKLAPQGTPLWKTAFYNFAPRLGVSWLAHNQPGKETVLRGGVGVFFDNNNKEAAAGYLGIGFGQLNIDVPATLPVPQAELAFTPSVQPPYATVYAFPNHLQLPYTIQWNTSLEQALGTRQTLTLSYVGANGRRLLQQQEIDATILNPNFTTILYYPTGISSSFNALEVKYQRTISHGVQALAAYTWSHSFDFGSTYGALPLTRGSSDFDVRSNFNAGLSWNLPYHRSESLSSKLLADWDLDLRVIARTAFPIDLGGDVIVDPATGQTYPGGVNVVPGNPIYLHGRQCPNLPNGICPGGRAINPAAFTSAIGSAAGTAPRNGVRGFGGSQINAAIRREVKFSDRLTLQFRAESFNILNHPNFGYVDPNLQDASFGEATMLLNQSLGTVASQYQQGGPRSMQFALKVLF